MNLKNVLIDLMKLSKVEFKNFLQMFATVIYSYQLSNKIEIAKFSFNGVEVLVTSINGESLDINFK